MVLDTSHAVTSTTTLAAPAYVPPADPWDAPYFGAPVYLRYQPTLPTIHATLHDPAAQADTSVPRSATLAADPWDAPYFGGPVYFGYRVQREQVSAPETVAAPEPAALVRLTFLPAAEAAEVAEAAEAVEAVEHEELFPPFTAPAPVPGGEPAFAPSAAQPGEKPRRRGWLARLLHRDLYLGRRG